MRKGKLIRSVFAMGMAFSLAAAPLSVSAEGLDETELAEDLYDAVEESVDEITAGAKEGYLWFDFGDGLYHLSETLDVTWLKNAALYGKIVPGADALDIEAIIGLNDIDLCQLLVSVDPQTGTTCVEVPELFDGAISVNFTELAEGMTSGKDAGGEDVSGGAYGPMIGIIANAGAQIAGQLADIVKTLPPDILQQEMVNYMMPVMNAIEQENGTDEITVGDVSVDVQAQIFDIPPEKMADAVSEILEALADDEVVSVLLQSEAVTNVLDLASMLTGGMVNISATDILGQYRGILQQMAAADFSWIPGIRFVVQHSEDGTANGFYLGLWNGDELSDLFSCRAIVDGSQHCFEITLGGMLPGMLLRGISEADVLGQGGVTDNMFNETVEATADGETVASLQIEDLDLSEAKGVNGTVRLELQGMRAEIIYDLLENGSQKIIYNVNDELFYDAFMWLGDAQDEEIDQADKANAVKITSVDDLVNWTKTFKADAFIEMLKEAGVPEELFSVQNNAA